jgi:NitT/TauT family transport system ATP-binding protein
MAVLDVMDDLRATDDSAADAPAPTHHTLDARGVPHPVVMAKDMSLVFAAQDGAVTALADVNLSIARHDFVSLIGPSGCGKTTLLRAVADLVKPTSGTLLVDGGTPEQARLDRSYGYVFQAPALYPWRNVRRNVELPLEIMGLPAAERRNRAAKALATVGLEGFEGKFPWQLSGGMQQRVSIARALGFEPDLLLMDEPFGALDEITRDNLNMHLHELWKSSRLTVIFVTHSIPEAVFLSTHIVVMSPRPGKIVEVIDCDLPRDRVLDMRETPEFLRIAQQVRDGLRAGHSYEAPGPK